MTQYKTRTQGIQRKERDLKKEIPLGLLNVGWHTGTVRRISISPMTVKFEIVDSFGDKLDTSIFIRQYDAPSTINTRLKAFLAAVCADPNEVMTLADAILDDEFHVLGSLDGRAIRCKVGYNGDDLDILQFNRADRPARKELSF